MTSDSKQSLIILCLGKYLSESFETLTPCIMCVQYIGGEGVQYIRGEGIQYIRGEGIQYIRGGRDSVHQGDTMSTSRDIMSTSGETMSTSGDVQYNGG